MISLLVVGIVGMFSILLMNIHSQPSLGSLETNNGYTSASASTGVLVTTSSTAVQATTTSRTLLKIANISSNPIYCNMDGGKPAVAYQGVTIAASSTLNLSDSDSFLYRGAVNCIAISVSASTTVYQR